MLGVHSAVVIGGGVAGASAAYFLGKAGVKVTVIDAGIHAASYVPSALINPVRGQSGQVDAKALAGMEFTWRLIAELTRAGHAIPHAQSGVLRPVPDDKTRAKFEKNLPDQLNYEWRPPAAPLSRGWPHALWLPEGGWVAGQAFCQALLDASGAQVIRGKAAKWTATGVNVSPTPRSPLAAARPTTYHADAVIYCGGSLGSTWARTNGAAKAVTHRMGSMLLFERAASDIPLSFGAYLAPYARGGVLGGTFEAPSPVWQAPNLPLTSLNWLLQKGQALADLSGAQVTGRWTGSRLSGLQQGQDDSGVWHLTGLGSKGFLLGPLLAADLAKQLTG